MLKLKNHEKWMWQTLRKWSTWQKTEHDADNANDKKTWQWWMW